MCFQKFKFLVPRERCDVVGKDREQILVASSGFRFGLCVELLVLKIPRSAVR